MFILYQSNDFKILKYMFLYIYKKKNIYINHNSIILISNNNISLKLKTFFSKYLNIFANFKFFLPAQFIWNLCKKFLLNISDINYYNKFNLIFIIMILLPKLINRKEFYILKKYLLNDYDCNKLFNLSVKIADLYDKYLVYRYDLLMNWEKNILNTKIDNLNQIWQSILWRKIVNYFFLKFNCKLHRSRVLLKFLYILKLKKNNLFKNIYKDIFIFNVNNLPPLYLDIIYYISKYINIHYFLINPCKEYWYDINLFNNINNDLLYNSSIYNINFMFLYYSKIFAEYLYLIFNYNILEISYFNKVFNNNILDKIKKNILYFNDKKYNKKIKYNNKYLDKSIIIKSCYGYLNEVNELKKFLLKLIVKKKYKFNEIIVVFTDINKYYFYINLIFSDFRYKNIISYFIIDENINDKNYIFNFFLKILNIKDLNLNTYEFLKILKNKIILNKFNIDNNELEILLNFINNISFLRDIKNFIFDKILFDKLNSSCLIDNIKSLLLGYAVNKKFFIWNNIINFNFINNNYFNNLIGKFSHFIFKIFYWKKILFNKFTFNNWILICSEIINDFFDINLINNYFFLNDIYLNNLLNDFNIVNFKKKIDNKLFIKILCIYFKNKNFKQFSLNSINFSSFLHLRSIPFKVICILGMNLNVYPKSIINCNFDLMYLYPKIGDRNKIENEKYMFLEYCLSAQNILYISYLNMSLDNFSKCFPSILLDNLLNYINSNFNFNFNLNKKKIFIINNNNIVLNNKNLNLNKNIIFYYKNIKKKFFLKELHNFWFNPIKFFFNYSLKIKFYEFENFLKFNYLDFNIKNFYFYRKIFINYLLNGKIFNNNFFLYLQMLNLIPLGNFGKILWNIEKYKIIKIFSCIKNKCLLFKDYKFSIYINNINIYGFLKINKFKCHYKWIPKNLNLIDGLLFWIDHLIYCYLGGMKESILYGYNNIFIFKKLNFNLAKDMLCFYINGFLYGIKYPLCFLPKCSNFLLFNIYDFNNNCIYKNNNLYKILFFKINKIMYGNNYFNGELSNLYIDYLIKNNYIINYNIIFNEAKKWLCPMLKFLKIKYY